MAPVIVEFEDAHAGHASARLGLVPGALVVTHASLVGRPGVTAVAVCGHGFTLYTETNRATSVR